METYDKQSHGDQDGEDYTRPKQDFVIVHGRFSGFGAPVNWIAADIVRIQDGILVEHFDVIQDEATEEQSISKRPMFGKTFLTYK